MMKSAVQEIVSKAFQLAYFIHPDRQTALSITREAFSSLHKHLKPQEKRMYYRLRGRIVDGFTLKGRNKISLEQSQKLQLLIYLYSEKIEKQQEAAFIAASSLDESHQAIQSDDCIVRFLEHLISITISRSAFYVALGLGRVAFNYSTAQTAAIYDVIHPDGQCKKDSPYFRKRKNEFLMKSLKERFGALVRTHLVAHGEERFQARADSSSFMPFVNECLEMFTPWNTPCVLPERLDPMNKEIDQLRFNDTDPDKEHPVEAQRMHSIIHPHCFSRIVKALALPAPEQRLQVPLFFLNHSPSDDDQSSGSDRRNPPNLTTSEQAEIEHFIQVQHKRSRRAQPQAVSVIVDGLERGAVKMDACPLSLHVSENARLLEITTTDELGELLLGVLVLDQCELSKASPSTDYILRLTNGSELRLTLTPCHDTEGSVEVIDLEISFHSARSPLAVSDSYVSIFRAGIQLLASRPVLISGTLILMLSGLFAVLTLRRQPEFVAQIEPELSPMSRAEPSPTGAHSESNAQTPTDQSSPGKQTNQTAPRITQPHADTSDEGVRSVGTETAAELAAIRKINVVEYHDGINPAVHQALIATIAVSDRLRTAGEADADGFLTWEIKRIGQYQRLELRLTSRIGRTLWSSSRIIRKDEQAAAAAAAQEMIRKLMAKMSQPESHRYSP